MVYSLESTPQQQLFDGYRARIQHGEQITFAVVEADANASLPRHSHHNEQAGLVIAGAIAMTIDGETRLMKTGDGWVIPANAVHEATAGPDGAVIVECWCPPRDDFKVLPIA
jgi:quercetin dioxygenase-like cupin family protein